jgi:hypothetical protein
MNPELWIIQPLGIRTFSKDFDRMGDTRIHFLLQCAMIPVLFPDLAQKMGQFMGDLCSRVHV